MREVLRRDLSALGYSCTTASDGREALEKMRANNFDVALVDLRMPRMDGIELLHAIEATDIDAIPIVLTGYGEVSNAVDAIKHGAFEFIEKPASTEAIHGAINRAIKHRQALHYAHAVTHLAQQLETIFDASPDMIIVTDTDQRILRVNRAMVEKTGHQKGDLIGRLSHEALCADSHPPEECPFAEDLGGRGSRTREFVQVGWGDKFQIISVLLKDSSQLPWGSLHTIREITDRRRTQGESCDNHVRSELLIASISSVLVCLDETGTISEWNGEAESILGIPSNDAIGQPLSECNIQWNFDMIASAVGQCLGGCSPVRVDDIPFTRQDGKNGFLAVTANLLKDKSGRGVGVLILGRDITKQKLLESQLTQAQKLESIGQLAAGIAHEINTPMQYVGDNTRFLQESFSEILGVLETFQSLLAANNVGKAPAELVAELEQALSNTDVKYLLEEIPQALEQSMEGVGRVAKIVRAMRNLAPVGDEQKTPVDINSTIDSTVTVCRNEWKYVANVEMDLAGDLPPLLCLPAELSQVILDLIINAARAIGEVVGERPERKGTIIVSTRRDGDWVEIRVRDTGGGIPDQIRSKVFDPFFTTKEVGAGVGHGLSIAHSVVVDKHGGTITFETETGEGTTFIVQLPVDPGLEKELSQPVEETADAK